MPIKKTTIYFPNLDGLRFIAFFLVFFNHIFYVKNTTVTPGGELYLFLQALDENGSLGVNLFFVLSGFLITYLLINEGTRYGKIHLINFYIRRFLRIWPLYFLMVAIGFFVFPFFKQLLGENPNETHSIFYYIFFISNFHMLKVGWPDSSVLSVLWSVGIEEQFYLAWPLLLKIIPQRFLAIFFCLILAAILTFRFSHSGDKLLLYFHTFSVIGDMVVGGLAAYLIFISQRFKSYFENLSAWRIRVVYVIGALVIFFNYKIFATPMLIAVERLVISLFFIFIILEQNFSKRSFYKCSSSKFLTKWGNYTYGLYCWQMPGLLISYIITSRFMDITNPWFDMSINFGLGLPITMILAYLSYHILEKRFLKLKERFSFIVK